MNLRIIITLFILSFLNVEGVYAQLKNYSTGFVVKTSGDTIYGNLKRYDDAGSCRSIKFKNDEGEKVKFNIRKVTCYKRDDELFMVKYRQRPISVFRTSKSYMKVLETGKVNLYEYFYVVQSGGYMGSNGVYMGGASSIVSDYYLENSFGDFELVRTISFKKDMAKFFSKNESLASEILNKELRYNDLREIVRIYNGK